MAALSAISSDPSRRFLLSGAAALALIAVAGCGPKKEEAPE
ncbi:MAG: methyltransferase, partial [Brevundimonas sp.]|nr:methyltransferase [Brevundimonas sp.]